MFLCVSFKGGVRLLFSNPFPEASLNPQEGGKQMIIARLTRIINDSSELPNTKKTKRAATPLQRKSHVLMMGERVWPFQLAGAQAKNNEKIWFFMSEEIEKEWKIVEGSRSDRCFGIVGWCPRNSPSVRTVWISWMYDLMCWGGWMGSSRSSLLEKNGCTNDPASFVFSIGIWHRSSRTHRECLERESKKEMIFDYWWGCCANFQMASEQANRMLFGLTKRKTVPVQRPRSNRMWLCT